MEKEVDTKRLKPSEINKILSQLNEDNQLQSDPFELLRVEEYKGRGPKGLTQKKLNQLDDGIKKYQEIIGQRPSLSDAEKCLNQLQNSKTQKKHTEDIAILKEVINQVKDWIDRYNKLKENAKLEDYEELIQDFSSLKLRCPEIKQGVKKLKDFRVWQNNLQKLLRKLRRKHIKETGQQKEIEEEADEREEGSVGKIRPKKREYVKEEEISSLINQYQTIGILIEEADEPLKEIFEKVEQANDLQKKIQNAVNDQDLTKDEWKQLEEEYEQQNILIEDYLVLKYRMTGNEEAEKYLQEEADISLLQDKIKQLKSITGQIGTEEREQLIKSLENKLDIAKELEENFQKRLSKIVQIKETEILAIRDFLREAKLKGVIVPSVKKGQAILRVCIWIQKLYNMLSNPEGMELEDDETTTGGGGGTEDIDLTLYYQIDKIDEQIEYVLQKLQEDKLNLTQQQLESLYKQISKYELPDDRVKLIYNKITQLTWRKHAIQLVLNEEVSYQQLENIEKNVPDTEKQSELYQKIQQLCVKATQWNSIVNNFVGGDSLSKNINQQFALLNSDDNKIRENSEEEIERIERKIKQLLSEYNEDLATIKDFQVQATTLQRYKDWINWYRESQQTLSDMKSGKISVKSDYIKAKVYKADELKVPQEWKQYKELHQALENFDELEKEIELYVLIQQQQQQQQDNKKRSFQKAKQILQKAKNTQQLEDISSQIEVIEGNIVKCEEWLEQVITFTRNSALTQEYLDNKLNLDFLYQTINDLRQKSQDLPYVVDEGQQILNDFEWAISVSLLLIGTNKKEKKSQLQEWIEYLNYANRNPTCNSELVSQLRDNITQAERLIDSVNRIKKYDNSFQKGETPTTKTNLISIEELKALTANVFSFKIELKNEIEYLRNLLQNVHKTLEALNNMMQQKDPKPSIVDIQKMIEQLRRLPVDSRDYQGAVEIKISEAQNLAKKIRRTYEVDAQTAENLIKEYNSCNLFITDGYRLTKAYEDSKSTLKGLTKRLKLFTEEQPLAYDEILSLSEQADTVQFDINNELSQLKLKLYILRVECIRESNSILLRDKEYEEEFQQQQFREKLGEEISSSVKVYMDIPYQAPQRTITITFQTLKSLLLQGYSLRNKFVNNDQLADVIKFMEWIAGKVEDFVLDIYKIKDPKKLEDIDPLCCGFVDCSNLIIDHKSSLLFNSAGYIPVLESLIIKETDKLQALTDIVPLYTLNVRPSPHGGQIELESDDDHNKKYSVSKGKITPSDNLKKRGRPKKSLQQEKEDKRYSSDIYSKDKMIKKIRVESNNRDKGRKITKKEIKERELELKRELKRDLKQKKIEDELRKQISRDLKKKLKIEIQREGEIEDKLNRRMREQQLKDKLKSKSKNIQVEDSSDSDIYNNKENIRARFMQVPGTKGGKKRGQDAVLEALGIKDKKKKKGQSINEDDEKQFFSTKLKKARSDKFNVIEERRRFWDDTTKKKSDEGITEVIRSENIAKLRTLLERCKYLNLTSLDTLHVAKRLENACFLENSKNKKNYEKFINAMASALKNIRKMKYISLRFIEENYSMDYLYQFKELQFETLLRENDRAKEIMIQRRLKNKLERENLVKKRFGSSIISNNTEKIYKKIKKNDTPISYQYSRQSQQQQQPSTKLSRSVSIDDFVNTQKKKQITPNRSVVKKKPVEDVEELLLTQNLEPIDDEEYRVQKKRQQQQRSSSAAQRYPQQQQPDGVKVLKIYEGLMRFSARSATKVVLLTTGNSDDLQRIPRLLYNDKSPLIAESSITQEAFNIIFESLIYKGAEDRTELISTGWIQTTLDLYRNLCTTLANEYLNQGIVGLTEYSDYSTIYFLHKAQIKGEWEAQLNNITKGKDVQYNSRLCYIIVSKDYTHSQEFPKLQIEQFSGVYYKKKISRSASPTRLLEEGQLEAIQRSQNVYERNKNKRNLETLVQTNSKSPHDTTTHNRITGPTTTSATTLQQQQQQQYIKQYPPGQFQYLRGSNQQQLQQQAMFTSQKKRNYLDYPNQSKAQTQQQRGRYYNYYLQQQQGRQKPQQQQSEPLQQQQQQSLQELKNTYLKANSTKKSPISEYFNQAQQLQQIKEDTLLPQTTSDNITNTNTQFGQIPAPTPPPPQPQYQGQEDQRFSLSNNISKLEQKLLKNPSLHKNPLQKAQTKTPPNEANRYNIPPQQQQQQQYNQEQIPRFSPLGRQIPPQQQQQQQGDIPPVGPGLIPPRRPDYYLDDPYLARSRSPYLRYPPVPREYEYDDYVGLPRDPYYRDYDYYERPYYPPPPYLYSPYPYGYGRYHPYDYYRRPPPPYYDEYDMPPPAFDYDYPLPEYERDMLYNRPPPPFRYPGYGSRGQSAERDFPGPKTPARRYPPEEPEDFTNYPPPSRTQMETEYVRRPQSEDARRQQKPITPRGVAPPIREQEQTKF